MADEQDHRPIRSNETSGRAASSAAAANDPLAELARLIGQNDPFAEFGRDTPVPIVEAEQYPAAMAPPAAPKPASDYIVPPAAPSRASDYIAPPAAPSRPSDYISPPMSAPLSRPSMPPPPKFEHEPLGVHGFAKATDFDHAPTAPAHADTHEHDQDEHFQHEPMHASDDEEYFDYDDEAPPRRRMGVIAVAAVIALAVVGTAGAFGYRAMFGSSGVKSPPPVIKADTTPSKIVPTPEKSEAKQTKLSYDRVGARNSGEQLVSREEKPVAIQPKPDGGMAGKQTAALQPALGSGVVGGEPKKVHTIVIHPDQPAGANPVAAPPLAAKPPATVAAPHATMPAAPAARTVTAPMPEPRHVATRTIEPPARAPVHSNAPLSLNPGAAPRPAQTASTAPTQPAPPPAAVANGAHGYAVQLSAQRSEAEAQASFRGMQTKYPSQLGGQQLMIRKVELGTKGTYYRTLVGPFGSQNAAVELCTKLKAAGGKCFVQKI
jgi:SPOR domain